MGRTMGDLGMVWNTRKRILLATVALTIVAACSEREIILPGKREPVSAVLTADTAEAEALTEAARDIALPPQVANTDAAQSFGTPAFRTDHPQLGQTLTPVWSVDIGAGDSRKHRIVADPVVSGGRVFTLDAETTVTAVSTSGQVLWQRDILTDRANSGEGTGGGLAVDGNVLFVSSGLGTLTALDVETGGTIWEQELEAIGVGRPTAFENLVYVMAGDDTGWALEKDSGRIAWQVSSSETRTNVLGGPAPIVTDGLAVFSFGSGEMQAVFRQGGLRRWDASVLGERQGRALAKVDDVTGRPIAKDGVIYAGNQSGRTVAVNAGSGAPIWTSAEGAIDTVLPVAGSVFLISDRNELVRLNAEDGTRVWGTRLPNFVKDRPLRQSEVFAHHGPVLAGGRLLVASSDETLRSFDPVSGGLTGRTEIPGGATTAPVVAGQTLYVVSRKGQLLAYR
ncbi:PQQ-like beta-propeller repeat protein [uncultured Tateyamaria sp.]|uniref:outer membrane protein assembly factor BamB family protein n=1 Tax=uncultured Tateyamaria sp. TaxID=455651 RepID=UPI00262B9B27|nr:PQQ-like beta-propeller repeat protein [uncultured Tateyamaria sp.]